MQPIAWYTHRLQSMSLKEIGWRLTSLCQNSVDRIRIPLGFYPQLEHPTGQEFMPSPGFSVSPVATGEWMGNETSSAEKNYLPSLLHKADLISAHRLTYFNLQAHDHGTPFDWHRDHSAGKPSPQRFAASIDYRDFGGTGDCKLVWEPNRHHHLVILGRAYRASGHQKYAEAVRTQLLAWLDANPYGYGMNWRSPMELAIRLINWVWALDLIRDANAIEDNLYKRIRQSVYLHLYDITRKFSQGSSANNHVIGEAAGVFIACCYFRDLPNTVSWRQKSYEILCQEIKTQITAEGCHRELALGYHFFVFQFFLFAGLTGRHSGMEFPAAYWNSIEQMLTFLSQLAQGGRPPLFGDCDDGYVLNLGNSPHETGPLFAIGAALFNRQDFKTLAGENLEPLCWLLGKKGLAVYEQLSGQKTSDRLTSHAFQEAGFYLLQDGTLRSHEKISLLIDCGDLGYKSIAAHGHADALHFTLRVGGNDIFVDPGTFDYFTFPEWRNYFRSTRAHNTVEVDHTNQSVMLGPFMWGHRAVARCLRWEPTPRGGKFTGEHDGYARLEDPVRHRRTVELDGETQQLVVIDELYATSKHLVRIFFHCAPECKVDECAPQQLRITNGQQTMLMQFDPSLEIKRLLGSKQPIGGWLSQGYHQKIPAPTIVAQSEGNGNCSFRTVIFMRKE